MLTKGTTVTINTSDTNFRRFNGTTVEIIRVIDTPDDQHDAEVLPMFEVSLAGSGTAEFWTDELTI